jgi:predicted amidohydrolase YtcJ
MEQVLRRGAPLLMTLMAAATTALAQPADRIWTGGTVLTMNDAAMRAEAVAERGGRIVAVGSRTDVLKLQGPGTKLIDLGGRTLLPGFVDAHGHVTMGGFQALSANLLAPPDGEVRDIASLQKTLRDWIAANADAVKKANLVAGFGYDNSQLKEQRHPTRDELDAVSKDLPVVAVHQSGHLGVLNSKALELVGYGAQTPDPQGGVIQRRPGSQEPNGVLEENALNLALPKLLAGIGAAGFQAFAKAGSELWARFGYTTAQEGRATPPVVGVLRAAADKGELKIDVAAYPDVLIDRDFIKAQASRDYRNRLRVAGAKLTIDGSPQGFTAWRDRPYYKPVGNYPPGYVGYASATNAQVIDAVDWAYANGVQIMTHSNGEAASDLLIAAITAATRKHGQADRRAVLIHGQFLREDQVDAINRLDVIPSLFPMHTFYWGDWHREHTVGPALADNISPTGWAVARGMRFTSHHDAPVAFPDSMRVLDATVTRRSRSGDIIGPAQRVDVITALKAMTLWPAYQHFEEANKGSIEVGKLADFVILSQDPTATEAEKIDQIKVTETVKEGQTIYAAAAEARKAALQLGPERAGGDTFMRLLAAGAAHREAQAQPAFARPLRVGRHDTACLAGYLDQLRNEALLAQATPR